MPKVRFIGPLKVAPKGVQVYEGIKVKWNREVNGKDLLILTDEIPAEIAEYICAGTESFELYVTKKAQKNEVPGPGPKGHLPKK